MNGKKNSMNNSIQNLQIRPATPADVPQILAFITELAIYEKAEHEVVATEQHIQDALFCAQPRAFALICEAKDQAIGFAVYFYNYSTWLGQHGIYLEDLYVTPESRGLGAGKALLKQLAEIALAENCGRVEWSVLDWNKPAIDFYESLHAKPQDEWTVYRLSGNSLSSFAKK